MCHSYTSYLAFISLFQSLITPYLIYAEMEKKFCLKIMHLLLFRQIRTSPSN